MKKRGVWRRIAGWGVIVVLIVGGGRNAGQWLVVQDAVEQVDLAVVLSGQPVTRTLAARDLYQGGRARRILVVPEPADPIVDAELIRLGLEEAAPASWPERILSAAGVPREQIDVLSHPADGTIREAVSVRDFMRSLAPERRPKSLMLITTPSASRRARWIFRHVLASERLAVWVMSTPYDRFEARQWWHHPRNALVVVTEYQKLLVNALQLMVGWYQR